ncbi:rRNA methyltransferase [Rodentibacter pneumotropicus]|uniref:rRNA methyltransferase n=1 Tax=Rodentibacter pneumotropicus TaxID=758 RepID=A0AAW5LCL1_9PAST|nr:TrmH family RNA methyltransferase [Rodentibacter pneumotropicus]MCQ9121800.1 rRNA methyltransferase [Rodentibacter pneumotropicus]OOF68686.1 rRNA methyltransferase [Rodentibacter pneumotropicus]
MNNSRKPTFQTNTNKSFQERSFDGLQHSKKHRENRPHFDKKNDERKKQRRFQQEVHEPQIAELSLNKSGGVQGSVKVVVKSTGVAYKAKEKKTGALSPRAPEKIKKNRAEEMKVYGENACLALFEKRPESIIRVWATVQMSHKIGEIFSYLATNKKVYHVVDNEELSLVSGTEHHGGICMLVKRQRSFTLQGYLDIPREEDCLVLLDSVNNAQNIGGVLRTCAFYGVKNVVTNNADKLYSAAAMRVAEGGAEYIRLLECLEIESALQQLRQRGYQVVHIAQGKEGIALNSLQLNKKVAFLFSEADTLDLYEKQDVNVRLSLSNPLKNGLNIAVNSGILLAKWYFSK